MPFKNDKQRRGFFGHTNIKIGNKKTAPLQVFEEHYVDCPFCKMMNSDYGGDDGIYSGQEIKCEHCGKTFLVTDY